jgi:hypothetical protein
VDRAVLDGSGRGHSCQCNLRASLSASQVP